MDLASTNTLLDIQHRPNELGRIRLGAKAVTKGGKEYPTTLDTWRLTSGSLTLLDAAAVVYGGTPEVWEDAPDEGYYQLLTESRELRVLIPQALRTVSQSYELWQGGTCMRRCDGKVEQISDQPCLCDPAARECEVMTRVSLMLPDVPGLGVWRLDTGGWHAATSLPATIELLKQLSTQPWIPAILRLEQRSKKVREGNAVVTHRFAVPVLDLPNITVGKVVARMGNAEAPRLEAQARPPQPTAAERAAEKAAAITSGPAPLVPREAGTVEEVRDDPQGEPPPPAAAALDAIPPRSETGSAIEGLTTPIPDGSAKTMAAPTCDAPSPYEDGWLCFLPKGHRNAHRSPEATWV